tara:strand:- start:417 stop:818 length:402 start_codon:yes stop_codon:yes gene_type:complete
MPSGELQDYSVESVASSLVLILGGVGAVLTILLSSRCGCRIRLGLSDECYIFDCSRSPPPDKPDPEAEDPESKKPKSPKSDKAGKADKVDKADKVELEKRYNAEKVKISEERLSADIDREVEPEPEPEQVALP